ncbi:hypothetical protein B0T11DRAFT_118346 [Plectosphaerella cucumerina]|uniref:Uncharacterized protein n=1 Tax=Plectosphaerella cucumerina TaxID=40658 RepID=A0A8K0TAQ4_9PEZI|nr:hypothetical protein B0T11DRAFT_118346 [Plectosphaerella cucumerina]
MRLGWADWASCTLRLSRPGHTAPPQRTCTCGHKPRETIHAVSPTFQGQAGQCNVHLLSRAMAAGLHAGPQSRGGTPHLQGREERAREESLFPFSSSVKITSDLPASSSPHGQGWSRPASPPTSLGHGQQQQGCSLCWPVGGASCGCVDLDEQRGWWTPDGPPKDQPRSLQTHRTHRTWLHLLCSALLCSSTVAAVSAGWGPTLRSRLESHPAPWHSSHGTTAQAFGCLFKLATDGQASGPRLQHRLSPAYTASAF